MYPFRSDYPYVLPYGANDLPGSSSSRSSSPVLPSFEDEYTRQQRQAQATMAAYAHAHAHAHAIAAAASTLSPTGYTPVGYPGPGSGFVPQGMVSPTMPSTPGWGMMGSFVPLPPSPSMLGAAVVPLPPSPRVSPRVSPRMGPMPLPMVPYYHPIDPYFLPHGQYSFNPLCQSRN